MGNASRISVIKSSISVHPHVHGERIHCTIDKSINNGSSPRAWGTHCKYPGKSIKHRFIPTCMGNAPLSCSTTQKNSVHPHVHGERDGASEGMMCARGSSPRAWGTHLHALGDGTQGRFIPTCMGNAMCSASAAGMPTVHPHVHGERGLTAPSPYTPSGSSPRAWGTLR